jgi:tetratricopeptide (TPR) repeat protein
VTTESNSPTSLTKLAQQAYQENRLEDAAEFFQSAHAAFLETQDPLGAAESSNNLSVVLLKLGQTEEALNIVKGTPEIFLEAGDEKSAAMAYGNLASAFEACGELEEAEAALREAAERFRALDDKELLLYTQRSLSQLQLRQGRTFEALGSMQSGLEDQKKLGVRYRFLRRLLKIPARFLNR